MKYLKLGNTDLNVSRICLGLHDLRRTEPRQSRPTLPEESSRPLRNRRWKPASTFSTPPTAIPTAAARKSSAAARYARREDVVVATKVYFPLSNLKRGLSRANIMQSIDDSLRRPDTDYVDLLQIHRWDYETPLEETLALHDVVKAGKARYIGASSMYARAVRQGAVYRRSARLDALRQHAGSIQPDSARRRARNASAVRRRRHRRAAVEPAGARPPDPPSGETTARLVSDQFGKSLYEETEGIDAIIAERVASLAEERGVSRAQIALARLLNKPAVSAPIVGASREQLDDAIAAVDLSLSPQEVAELETAYVPHRVTGFE